VVVRHRPPSPKTLLFWGPVVQELYIGLQGAGPRLTAQTFAGAMFNYPPTGGTDTTGKSGLDLFLGGYLDGDTTRPSASGSTTAPRPPTMWPSMTSRRSGGAPPREDR